MASPDLSQAHALSFCSASVSIPAQEEGAAVIEALMWLPALITTLMTLEGLGFGCWLCISTIRVELHLVLEKFLLMPALVNTPYNSAFPMQVGGP